MYSDSPASLPAPPDTPIAGRYRLGAEIGAGAQGSVYEAVDLYSRKELVIKLFPSEVPLAALRRELAALRALALPGVVAILDDGVHERTPFIAMERAEGEPFPGPLPATWDVLAPIVARLLQILAVAHRRGVFHLDLKPAHVLVSGRQVTLIDFGFARGPGVDGLQASEGGGNPRYAAPEQYTGQPAGARSDLYAVGLMTYEALSGRFPFANMAERFRRDVPALPEGAAPPEVREAIARMLRRRPEDRPRDGWEVLRALGRDPAAPVGAWFPSLPSRDALAIRLGPPDPLLDRPGRAADALLGACRDPEELADALRQMIHTGQAEVEDEDGGRLRLASDAPPAEGTPLDPAAVFADAIARAAQAEAAGLLPRCVRALSVALSACRADPGLPSQDVLVRWTRAALSENTLGAVQRALYEVLRAPVCPASADLEGILHAARITLGGDGARALALLDRLRPGQVEIAIAAAMVALLASTRVSADQQREVTDRMAPLLVHAEARARLLSWRGRRAYAAADFPEAARLQEEALSEAESAILKLACRLYAAVAWLEIEPERALAGAERALAEARAAEAPFYAGRAMWLARQARYRLGEDLPPDPSVVEAARRMGLGTLVGHLALGEAVFAWRSGEVGLASGLASVAADAFVQAGFIPAIALAKAFRNHLAGSPGSPDGAAVLASGWFEIHWQILALAPPGDPTQREEALRRARTAPHPTRRREILSPAEAAARISQARPPAPSPL